VSDFAQHAGTPGTRRRAQDTFWLWAGALTVVAVGLATTFYAQYVRERNPSVNEAVEPEHVDPLTDIPVLTEAPPPPLIEAPPLDIEPDPSLPTLDKSDNEILVWLGERFGAAAVARFVVPERVVRNLVVTIDNLPRQQVVPQQRPIRPTPGKFLTTGSEDEPVLAPANYERYAPLVALVRDMDAATLVALYRRFRPLFQQAYEELGYPSQSFDARLIAVIDHLLATPEVSGPIRLVQPRVMYQYADPELEAQSAGRKLLIRMGGVNAAVVKSKLREIRAELSRQ
jgi:Protein of unknown function (DUF3014)